jgi:hypothetical protein
VRRTELPADRRASCAPALTAAQGLAHVSAERRAELTAGALGRWTSAPDQLHATQRLPQSVPWHNQVALVREVRHLALDKVQLGQHWRGDLTLGRSFWLSGLRFVVATLVAGWALAAVKQRLGKFQLVISGVFLLIALGLFVWYAVGVWRSAGRRSREQRWRALAARAGLVLATLSVVAGIAREGMLTRREMTTQREWLTSHGKWEFRLLRNDTELAMTGGIGPGFAKDLERMLAEHPRLTTLHTNLGLGGLVTEAQQAATSVQIRSLTTYVSATCASACTLVYLAGNERVLRHGGRLGFHSVSAPGVHGSALLDTQRQQIEYLYSRGVAQDFASFAAHTPPDDVWFPTEATLVRARVVHRVDDGSTFATSGASLPPDKIENQLLETRLYRVLKAKHPAIFAKVVAALGDGLRAGKSKQELGDDAKRILNSFLQSELPLAGDSATLRFARVELEHLGILARQRGSACSDYLDGGADAARTTKAYENFSEGLQGEELEAMADVLDSAEADPSHGDPKGTTRRLALAQGRVRERLARGSLTAAMAPVAAAPRCEDAHRYLLTVLGLSPADAALVLRASFAKPAR